MFNMGFLIDNLYLYSNIPNRFEINNIQKILKKRYNMTIIWRDSVICKDTLIAVRGILLVKAT